MRVVPGLSRALLAATLVVTSSLSFAQQAAPRHYGVLSLVGNTLAIHSERPTVATRVKGSSRDVLPLTDPAFDVAVLTGANRALKSVNPDLAVTLMTTEDAGLFAAQNALFDSPDANVENRNYLAGLLKQRSITHLVLVTKQRASAAFQVRNGSIGNGSLEGLGFFIDDTLTFRDKSNNESSNGMLTPFAYLKVRLVDAQTLAVLGERVVLESAVVTKPTHLDAMEAWQAMETSTKMGHLQRLLGMAMAGSVPGLIAQ